MNIARETLNLPRNRNVSKRDRSKSPLNPSICQTVLDEERKKEEKEVIGLKKRCTASGNLERESRPLFRAVNPEDSLISASAMNRGGLQPSPRRCGSSVSKFNSGTEGGWVKERTRSSRSNKANSLPFVNLTYVPPEWPMALYSV